MSKGFFRGSEGDRCLRSRFLLICSPLQIVFCNMGPNISPQTLYCNASCECISVHGSLLTDNYKYIITELRDPCVRSTGFTLNTLVLIGYAMRSKNAPFIIRG